MACFAYRCPEEKGFAIHDLKECKLVNVRLQQQIDQVNTREYNLSGKLKIEEDERWLLEEDLTSTSRTLRIISNCLQGWG